MVPANNLGGSISPGKVVSIPMDSMSHVFFKDPSQDHMIFSHLMDVTSKEEYENLVKWSKSEGPQRCLTQAEAFSIFYSFHEACG